MKLLNVMGVNRKRFIRVLPLFFLFLLGWGVLKASQTRSLGQSLPYRCESKPEDILKSHKYRTLLDKVKVERLSFLSRCVLLELMKMIISLECNDSTPRNAEMIEAGVAAGGSAISFASVKRRERLFYLYDTFEGMPEPSQRDGADVHRRYKAIQKNKGKNDGYYGNIKNLKQYVTDKFQQLEVPAKNHAVRMKQGLFQITIPKDEQKPVMFVNVDGDWYDSVYTVLDRVGNRVMRGGMIYIDDYGSYSGATNATNDFLAEERNKNKWHFSRVKCEGGRPILTRIS